MHFVKSKCKVHDPKSLSSHYDSRITFSTLNSKLLEMECRTGCGVCCIYISISSPIPGMPFGKPAGVKCVQLLDDFRCAIFNDSERPEVCSGFKADMLFCGNTAEEAKKTAEWLMGT